MDRLSSEDLKEEKAVITSFLIISAFLPFWSALPFDASTRRTVPWALPTTFPLFWPIRSISFGEVTRGEYDTAVFQAFREVEVAVRSAGQFPAEQLGKELMRKAFKPADAKNAAVIPGTLVDTILPVAEQQGMADLFSGAISLYNNPQSHRNVTVDKRLSWASN